MINKESAEKKIIAVILIALIFFISLPMLLPYLFHTHDINFHLRRIGQIAAGLSYKQIPVKLQLGWYNDHGYPTGVYYGDLLLYPPAFIHMLGVPLYKCYQLYVIFVNSMVVFSSYKCFRILSNRADAGLIGSVLYSGSSWYLTDVYYRGSLGEYSSFIFLPVVLTGFYMIINSSHKGTEQKRGSIFLILGFSGLLNTHIITTELVLGASFIVFLATIRYWFKEKRINALAASALAAALVNAGFIVPFVHYFLGFRVLANYGGGIQSRGTTFMQWFSTEYNADGFASELKNGISGSMPETPGISLVLIVILTVILLSGFEINKKAEKKKILLFLILSAVSLFMGTNLFPYDFFERNLFLIYIFIGEYLQFPFRYFTLSVVLISALAVFIYTFVINEIEAKEPDNTHVAGKASVVYIITALLIFITLLQGLGIMSAKTNDDESVYRYADVGELPDSSDTLYIPEGIDDIENIADTNITISSGKAEVSNISREYLSYELDVDNKGGDSSTITFPLWNYPGYIAEDSEGKRLDIKSNAKTKEIDLLIPRDYRGHVMLGFKEPLFWRAAEIISVLSTGAYIIYIYKYIKEKRKAVNK